MLNINLMITIICTALILYIFYDLVLNKKNKGVEYYGVVSDCKYNVDRLLDEYVDCDWEQGKLLGSGKKGDAYEASCNLYPDIEFTLKEQKYADSDVIKKEAVNQMLAGSNVTPDVYDAFMCGSDGYIVTGKLHHKIYDYLKNKSPEDREALILNLQTQAITKFLEAASRGIVHKDTHIENMMINEDENGNPILYFIDWGYSDKKTLSDSEIKEKKIDIEQTFDLLRSNLTNPSFTTKTPAAPKGKKQFKRIFDTEPVYKTSFLSEESPNKKINSPSNYSSLSTTSKGFNNLFSKFEDEDNDYTVKRNISFDDSEAKTPPRISNNLFNAFDEIDDDEENDNTSRRLF
jgi:hypothetical protein